MSKGFYGPGGPYAIFASRALAIAKMRKEAADVCGNLEGLSEKELSDLADWEKKFQA